MHETVFASSILKIVLEEVKKCESAQRRFLVTEIRLEIGALACLEPGTLKGCFEIMAEGSAAEKARLNVQVRPLAGFCPDCGRRVRAVRGHFACPFCAGRAVDWQGGHEMDIAAIEVMPASPAACEEKYEQSG
jgi:hydrogenase nickel incorporation protein HypA/HybF